MHFVVRRLLCQDIYANVFVSIPSIYSMKIKGKNLRSWWFGFRAETPFAFWSSKRFEALNKVTKNQDALQQEPAAAGCCRRVLPQGELCLSCCLTKAP